jgi:hypothetical protein
LTAQRSRSGLIIAFTCAPTAESAPYDGQLHPPAAPGEKSLEPVTNGLLEIPDRGLGWTDAQQ